jgi:hypothetical protein
LRLKLEPAAQEIHLPIIKMMGKILHLFSPARKRLNSSSGKRWTLAFRYGDKFKSQKDQK